MNIGNRSPATQIRFVYEGWTVTVEGVNYVLRKSGRVIRVTFGVSATMTVNEDRKYESVNGDTKQQIERSLNAKLREWSAPTFTDLSREVAARSGSAFF